MWSTGKNDGFTLVELAVVIFIIGLMTMFVLPNFLSLMTGRDVKGTARNLTGQIRLLRSRAVMEKRPLRLYLDLKNRRYWVAEPSDDMVFDESESAIPKTTDLPVGIRFKDIVTPRTGKILDGKTFVWFWPSGLTEYAWIHLSDDDNHDYTLVVRPLTGNTSFLEEYADIATH
ncbi:MAG: prepilin-type N-terminal cleavage/methylation domain-containing protein [Deltaproteobacteria bacterium]|nr:prepilin-type N-terminal cleavage/methylation domain-containing protein [Deltaproteobacteria bacterium]